MKKQLLIKSLLFPLFCFLSTFSFATINWVGNMFPASGSISEIAVGGTLNVYIQVYKAGTTEPSGQGAGITCEVYYGEVPSFGAAWQNTFTQSMTYNVDIGNNDEYQGGLSPLSAGLYEFTCRCSDDGGATWTWADLPSGNGQLEVTLPLPVELISFDAIPQDNLVQLNWSTASERNNDFFRLERSKDGVTFEEVAIIEGAGTSNVRNDYDFRDENPFQGVNYYRLQQVDFDGVSEFSNTISTEFISENQLSIFPNPVTEKFTIDSDLQDRDVQISIFSVNGQLVKLFDFELNGTTDLDVSDLQAGLYFMQIKERSGLTHFSNHFIKN